ncbi:beta strand repeat-containing protein [Methanobrevibacter cuticularis]|uniref:beta strand repeat-containing protein n=1 Tax=Methanobrevibacter cuticularis TaxID=47311 RepID=UPI001471DC49|nr:hypothetical protein [Methanobrevibacter cuticularis]
MKKIKNYKKAILKTSILIATILLLAISLNSSFAAIVNVDNSTAGGGIQQGLINATDNQNTINLATGTYTGTNNTGITINKNVTIQGNGPTTNVIINAQGQRRIFNMSDNLNVTFINITFTNGRSTVYVGTVNTYGGAIYNTYNTTTMTFINCTFTNNNGNIGGAIYNLGHNMSVSGSTFINSTGNMHGGAIYNFGINLNVSGSTFTNNKGTVGGAIYNDNANMSVSDSTFTNNTATTTTGGAISSDKVNMSVSGSTFINNSATTDGGAIRGVGANLSVNGSTFINNSATTGGAIRGGANFSVNGSTFINNSATTNGGSIYNSADNILVNYNRFLNNADSNGFDMVTTRSNTNADFNWWGKNNISGKISGINTNNHYILNITNSSSLDNLNIGDNVSFSLLVLNDTLTNDGVENLPDFVINGTFNSVAYNSSRADNFTYIFTILSVGNQTVHAYLDDQYVNRTFYAIKGSTNSTIVVNPNPAQIGENITVSGQLANHTGIGFVNVTVDGKLFTNVTVDGSGYWELNYTANRTGTDLEIVVSFAGDGNYDAFSNSTTFTVAKNSTNSTIVVSPNPAQIGENITVSGQLANYTGIGFVNVTVDGNLFADVIVDGSGYWELNYTTNRTGTFDIDVSFAGDGNYDAFSNSTTFTVAKNSTNSTIVVSPNPAQIGENITVSGQLANYTGIGFVNVTVDGNLFTDVIVDGSGYWELDYTTNCTGTDLEIVVSFAGNENYTSFTNTTSFNVTKLAVNSTINIPKDVKVGKTITIDGVLVDENRNPLANAPINVTVGGKVYSLITDSNGRWSLTYKPTHTGIINTVVNYAGNDKYFSYTNTTTFNVVKGEAIVDIDVVKNSDGSVDVIVTVTDEYGDPIHDYKVSVELDGKNIGNIVTDVLGIGRIHIPNSKLSEGKHVITATSDNANYNLSPISVEFETQNNKNDTNNTNKTSDNPVAIATMKNTGILIIAIILVLITIFGISIRRKQN